jgi:UDP-sugar transporter A1/2/3
MAALSPSHHRTRGFHAQLGMLKAKKKNLQEAVQPTSHDATKQLIKAAVLLALIAHNVTSLIVTRYSRTIPAEKKFSIPCAVITSELMKGGVCLCVLLLNEGSFSALLKAVAREHWKSAFPAALFFIQNQLLYVGLTHLDAASFQILMQFRLVTTALASVLMLNKRLSLQQWLSLLILGAGVAVVQLSIKRTSTAEHRQNQWTGVVAVFAICCTSAVGAVYFEGLLKGQSGVSIWTRNVQLSAYSLAGGVGSLYFSSDWPTIGQNGFTYGFTSLTIVVIALQASGGLLVAMVMKYADNILKGFALALAIIISSILSVVFFNFELTTSYAQGATMVIGAVFLYRAGPASKARIAAAPAVSASASAAIRAAEVAMKV